jgi:hypothetical protein
MSVVDKELVRRSGRGHHPLRYAGAGKTRENQEQFVFVLIGAPRELALDSGHLDVLIVDLTDDSRRQPL